MLVLAGPGSGKTRVITYRIAALIESGVKPYHICAITFTNKAAEEMRRRQIQILYGLEQSVRRSSERIRQHAATLEGRAGEFISTFHSLCVQILRTYAKAAGIHPNFSIYDDSDQTRCVKEALHDCDVDATSLPPGRVLEAISTLKNKLVDAETFKQQAEDFFSQTLAKVYARYQRILTERNGLDFDDLLMKAALLLEDNSTVWRELSDRFQYLLIDEYQDTNHAQYRLAKALVSNHNNICAVGDPDQSIYRWRGADIRNILAFEKDWPGATVIRAGGEFPQHGRDSAGGRQAHRLQPAPQAEESRAGPDATRASSASIATRMRPRKPMPSPGGFRSFSPRASPAGRSPYSTGSTP